MTSRRSEDEAGMSLIETVLALAIISIIASAASMGLSSFIQRIQIERLKSTMGDIRSQLRKEAANPINLQNSASALLGNDTLKNCYPTPNNCPHIHVTDQPYFSLWHSILIQGLPDLEKIAGDDKHPAYYSVDGQLCAGGPSPRCFIAATAQFWVSCPLTINNLVQIACPTQLQAINVRLRVYVDQDVVPPYYESAKYFSLPNMEDYNNHMGDYSIRVPIAAPSIGGLCPDGAIIKSVDLLGQVTCECLGNPQIDISVPGTKCPMICGSDGQILMGFRMDDVTKKWVPNCALPSSCVTQSTNHKTNFSCGAGRHITSVAYKPGCQATAAKKASDWKIDCSLDVTCCSDH
jgi:prepilin-type N-terminal cleavage/methylation domain-containing protein